MSPNLAAIILNAATNAVSSVYFAIAFTATVLAALVWGWFVGKYTYLAGPGGSAEEDHKNGDAGLGCCLFLLIFSLIIEFLRIVTTNDTASGHAEESSFSWWFTVWLVRSLVHTTVVFGILAFLHLALIRCLGGRLSEIRRMAIDGEVKTSDRKAKGSVTDREEF